MVSVCIPTYNRANQLRKAIQSLLNSDYSNIEIIISDNASVDQTFEICHEFLSKNAVVRYFRHPENIGPTRNFEFARAQAVGEYFLWLGDDDFLEKNYISSCVERLEGDESMVLVSGKAAYHRGDGLITNNGLIHDLSSNNPLQRVLKYLFFVGDNAIFYGVYRRHKVRTCFIPNCLAGDWIWIALVLLRGRAVMMPDVTIIREYGENMGISPAAIVKVIGAPSWHGALPLLAIFFNSAKYISRDLVHNQGKSIFIVIPTYLVIFFVMSLRGVVSFSHRWIPRLPFARMIYHKIFRRH